VVQEVDDRQGASVGTFQNHLTTETQRHRGLLLLCVLGASVVQKLSVESPSAPPWRLAQSKCSFFIDAAVKSESRSPGVRFKARHSFRMERLADRDGKSVDAVLARELLDVVSAHSEYLATAIPGFTAALRWPQS